MIKAVLFDMDGTMVDTENLDNDVALEVCKNLGFELTLEEQEERHGRTTKSFYEWLAKTRATDFNIEEAIQSQLIRFEAHLRKMEGAFEGARELPKMLVDKGYKLAIVSGGTKAHLDIILTSLGLADFFSVIVSADDVEESKPSPEGYLLGAKKIGVEPEECLVLEDGARGIQAGKEAGMKVIGVVNNGGQDLSKADMTVKNLAEITPELLKTL